MMIPLLRLQSIPLMFPPRTSSQMFLSNMSTAAHTDRISPEKVLSFWFEDLLPEDWFVAKDSVDATIRDKFQDVVEKASACELDSWRTNADGALAEIIALDQFSRNVYRNTPRAFAQDPLALALAQEAIGKGYDKALEPKKLSFLYMPFMHSESIMVHERAIELFSAPGLEFNLEFEKKHKTIIDRFGRYPHRNKILGRESTLEEDKFLTEPGSSF